MQYTAPVRVVGVVGAEWADGYVDSIGPGYKIGTIIGERYRGSQVVFAELHSDEPCKGEGCDERIYLRFVKVGDTLVFLRRNSDGGDYVAQKDRWPLWAAAFSAAGFSLSSDSQFAIQAFLPVDTIAYGSNTFRLVSRHCKDVTPPVAFRHPVFHDVRFDGLLFYVTRADSSCLTFEYVPYFSEKEIVWDRAPKEPNRSGYSWKQGAEFGNVEVRYDPFVTADVVQIERDANVAGHTRRGEPVYELKDPNHALLKAFYRDYEADLAKQEQRTEQDAPGIRPPRRSYEQFLGARPIFLWRDPFGRLTRFTNNDFLPVYMAEPIIYLYPSVAERVHVEAKPLHAIGASTPPYRRGWDVLALPTGRLTDLIDQKAHSYLFWEGLSSISPMRREGFVLAQAEVAGFLERMLPRLGLDERESRDFREAWLPRFHGAPYYFVTFLPRETIDQLAPLVVTPKPDAVIRVLMDFRPLWTREAVSAPHLAAPPARRGFTVVEWGGIQR
ncbi:MAG TPA: hypothetical protein VGV12_16525 [Gemmatimonadales bacterium]|nr:hypothetical protein [Gemmatimonadales bacterium]